jgi:glycosyltransferase involved in cell wall biosynthesis
MRIRILAGRLDRVTGGRHYNRELAIRLAARGHEVSVVCIDRPEGLPTELRLFSIEPFRQRPIPWLWRLEGIQLQRYYEEKLRLLPLERPDVVIAASEYFPRVHRKLYPNVPWIYLPHAMVATHDVERGASGIAYYVNIALARRMQKWALNNASATVRFTKYSCDELSRYYRTGVRPRFFVNPVGMEVPNRSRQKNDSGRARFLYVGSLIARKRLHVAIEALKSLRSRNWIFNIVGDGAERRTLEALVCEAGLSEQVCFHGFQSDPSFWYENSDLLLFPSQSESLGLAVLEAMSFGVPSLVIRADGISTHNPYEEIIEGESDGFFSRNADDFSRVLLRLYNNWRSVEDAGRSALETSRRFSWSKHLERYESLCSSLTLSR